MSFMFGLVGLGVGTYPIFAFKEALTNKPPSGLDIAKYHDWLSTQATLNELRTLAVDGDNAIRGLCDAIFLLCYVLIGLGVFTAIIAGCDMLKKAVKKPT